MRLEDLNLLLALLVLVPEAEQKVLVELLCGLLSLLTTVGPALQACGTDLCCVEPV